MNINLERLKNTFNYMEKIGETPVGGITRLALSDTDKEARDLFVKWMKESELTVQVDDVGNIYGIREGNNPNAKPIVFGSHFDSIENGGKYDGVLGLLCPLEIIRTLNDHSISTENPIIIVNLTNEEGTRFGPPMTGSGVLSGDFLIEDIYKEKDENGKVFLNQLEKIGYLGSRENRLTSAKAFIEMHIEQGPILDKLDIPIGAVEQIMGLTWLEVNVIGESNNSGPTPMEMRKDALCASAQMILAVQDLAQEIGEGAITTVGTLKIENESVNTVPGNVKFSVDVRHLDSNQRKKGVQLVTDKIREIANNYDVEINIKELWSIDTIEFSTEIADTIIEGAKHYGYPVRRMASGAGHLATYMNNLCPTSMLFVPSINGKSHSELEKTDWKDIEKACNVLLYSTQKLAQTLVKNE